MAPAPQQKEEVNSERFPRFHLTHLPFSLIHNHNLAMLKLPDWEGTRSHPRKLHRKGRNELLHCWFVMARADTARRLFCRPGCLYKPPSPPPLPKHFPSFSPFFSLSLFPLQASALTTARIFNLVSPVFFPSILSLLARSLSLSLRTCHLCSSPFDLAVDSGLQHFLLVEPNLACLGFLPSPPPFSSLRRLRDVKPCLAASSLDVKRSTTTTPPLSPTTVRQYLPWFDNARTSFPQRLSLCTLQVIFGVWFLFSKGCSVSRPSFRPLAIVVSSFFTSGPFTRSRYVARPNFILLA